jgi:hypothetical protein
MEEAFGPSQGAAVLDIGGEVGAAVVHTSAALGGAEIEITPDGRDWDGTHVAVRRRPTPGAGTGAVYCAVFGHLRAGTYRIRVRGSGDRPAGGLFSVVGGRVTEVDLD